MQPQHYRFWPKNLPKELSFPQTSLFYNLEVSAARYPDKAAVVFYDTPLSFAQLRSQAQALAGYLQQRCGVKRGDRVLLFMQNSPQFFVGFYGILRADATVVPVNPMNLTEELRHYVTDSDATVILTGQELFAQVRPLLGAGPSTRSSTTYGDYVTRDTDLPLPDAVKAQPQTLHEPGVTPWAEALAATLAPGAASRRPGGLVCDALHLGTTGRPKAASTPTRR